MSESELSLYDEVSKKLKKAYSKKTVLVCHIIRTDFVESLINIHNKLKTLNPTREIWIIGDGEKPGSQIVAKVFPEIIKVEIDIKEVLSTSVENKFITGSLGKNNSFNFENTGKRIRLTTDFKTLEV